MAAVDQAREPELPDGGAGPVGSEPAEPVSDRRAGWRAPGWLPVVVVAVPFVVLFLGLAGRALSVDWHPVHDFAFIELRTADVGTSHSPLLGPYSRFGWSHPGPALFAFLALPYRLAGSRPQGLLVGAVIINAAAVAATLAVVRRRGGPVLMGAVVVGLGVLIHALTPAAMLSPWNPLVTLLPCVLLFVLAWSLAQRDWAVLPVTVVVASFLVQSHVAYGLLVAAVLGVALVLAAVDRWSPWRSSPVPAPSPGRRWPVRRLVILSAVLAAVMWLPPVIDQVAGSQNLSTMASSFTGAHEGRPDLSTAAGVVAAYVTPGGSWVSGKDPLAPFAGTLQPDPVGNLVVPVLALLVGAIVAGWRRDRSGLALVIIALAAVAASVLSVGRVQGGLVAYLVQFLLPVGLLVWLAVLRAVAPLVGSAARWLADRTLGAARAASAEPFGWPGGSEPDRFRTPQAIAVLALASAVALVLVFGGIADAPPPDANQDATMARIQDAVVPALLGADGRPGLLGQAGGGAVAVRTDDDAVFPAPSARTVAAGIVPVLEHAGVPARLAEADWRSDEGLRAEQLVGPQRVDDGSRVAGTLAYVGGQRLDTYVPPPGSVELFRQEDRAALLESRRLEGELKDAFVAAGHPEAVDLIPTPSLVWVGFTYPDLARFAPEVNRIIAGRDQQRLAVYWQPSAA